MRTTLLILVFYFVLIQIETFATSPAPRFLTKKSCRFDGDGCKCVVRTFRGECCCKGRGVDALPTNLTASVKTLVMYNTSISRMEPNFFTAYPNLEEIDLFSLPQLEYFDGTALRNLSHLRKFSLVYCKQLEEISGVLIEKNLKLQSLILRDNGLRRMPNLHMTDDHKLEVEVDLSNNEIGYVWDGPVRGVRARSFRLNNNRIREIAGFAFRGSTFFRLFLNDNKDLEGLSVDSFRDIVELHHLDLSNTAIYELPINGLKNLKSLTLRNVPTLKRLPSVLSFTHLETAHFTYPHHCCLFKYVDDVVEGENGMYKNNMKEIHQRMCTQREDKTSRVRRERPRRELVTTTVPDLMAWFDPSWFFPEDHEVIDDEEELPEFASDQLGASKCLSVAVDTNSVRKFYHNITCTPQPDALNPCENIVGYGLLRRAIWFIWTLAIVGNVLVWLTLALAFERRMRVHYLFMFNLSIADLITAVYLGILATEDVLTADEYYRHAVWWQTGWGCKTAGFLAIFGSKLSIISMFLIAFEMAYNTRMGFYGRRLHPRTGWILMGCGWLFALFMASLPLFGISSYSTTSICLPLRVSNVLDRTYIIFGLMFNLISFAGMAVCYVFIIMMLKDPSTPSREEDKAIITKMALLIGTDAICWFPTLFFGLTASAGIPLISISNAKIFLVFFFPINAFANPFLYVFFTEVIQRKVKTKTMPVLKRITSTPQVALNSLSNFYHSQPPGRRDDIGSPTRLQVTQMTSLNSTPRGSNCSTVQKTVDSLDGLQMQDFPPRSSPRVSFQDECYSSSGSHRSSAESSRRSFAVPKRISAIPEVSDLSEHSSHSDHEHIPRKSQDERTSRFNWGRILARNRHESAKSMGQDSGRGSITSTATRDTERNSLASTEGDPFQPRPGENSPQIGRLGFPRRKYSPIPKSLCDRRQSAPLIRPTLTVTECSDNSS